MGLNNLDLRQAIVRRVQNKSGEELTDSSKALSAATNGRFPALACFSR